MQLQCARAIRQRPLSSFLGRTGQIRNYNAAVLGAGITGLTSAWQLTQDRNCDEVVIFEKSNRLGGWMESENIPVDGGEVLFEYGPRTLRSVFPTSLPLLTLATNLGLYDEIILTPKRSAAAQNRFIYYPDRLVKMPSFDTKLDLKGNIIRWLETLKDPVFKGIGTGVLRDIISPPRHFEDWSKDESVADFIGRRFGPNVAENLVSALFHGVWAGDIDQLSAQTLLGAARNLEGGVGGIGGFISGGVTASMLSRAISKTKTRSMDEFLAMRAISSTPESFERLQSLKEIATHASTFTFKRGVGQLVEALTAHLEAHPKVKIQKNTEIKTLGRTLNSSSISIESPSPLSKTESTWSEFDHVISTIPPVSLAKTMRPDTTSEQPRYKNPGHTPYLLNQQNYAVTAMVVNLYYSDPKLLPVDGFGYLIPRSVPYSQNPECGLGVIFASSSSVGKTTSGKPASQDTAPGTKLTVMMGGHYWDGRLEYPDHDTAVKMARSMLKRHMNITDAPTVARTRLQKDAIPQYTVGHLDRMYDLSMVVRHEFDDKLVLAGNWYNGIGVGDCVRQGIMSATYGVGMELQSEDRSPWRPWLLFDYQNWKMKGGVVTSPVRLVDSSI